MKNQKYSIAIILVIVLVVIAVAWFITGKNNTKQSQEQPNNQAASRFQTRSVDSAKLPANLPADLPLEKDARIVGNHEVADAESGTVQSDRSYATRKTLAENFTIYKSYLDKNGWEILTILDQPDYKMLSAKDAVGRLDIMFNYRTGTPDNLVSVYYTYKSVSSSSNK